MKKGPRKRAQNTSHNVIVSNVSLADARVLDNGLQTACDKPHFSYVLQLNSKCQTKFSVYAKPVFTLIDTGASNSYVSTEFYKSHLLKHGCKPRYLNKNMIIQTAGKQCINVKNVKVVSFQVASLQGDLDITVEAIVIPHINPPIVIGCSTLTSFNAQIIFDPQVPLPVPPIPLELEHSHCVTGAPKEVKLICRDIVPYAAKVVIESRHKNIKVLNPVVHAYPYRDYFTIQVYTESQNDILLRSGALSFQAVYKKVPTPLLAFATHEENNIYTPCPHATHTALQNSVRHGHFHGCYTMQHNDSERIYDVPHAQDSDVVFAEAGIPAKSIAVPECVIRDHTHREPVFTTTNRFAVLDSDELLTSSDQPDASVQPPVDSCRSRKLLNVRVDPVNYNHVSTQTDQRLYDSLRVASDPVCASGKNESVSAFDINAYLTLFPKLDKVPSQYKQDLENLLVDKKEAFFHPTLQDELKPANIDPIKLIVKPGSPVVNKQNFCHFNNEQKRIAHNQLMAWIKQGVAAYYPPNEPCFISPLVLVPGRGKNKHRLCINLQRLNELIVTVQSQVPNIQQLIHALGAGQNNFFHTVDLAQSYLQCPLHVDSYKWLCVRDPLTNLIVNMRCLPFGLINSGYYLCEAVNTAFADLFLSMNLTCYVDDMALATRPENALQAVKTILDRLIDYGFKANPEKSYFFQESVEYLGFDITPRGYSPTQKRIAILDQIPYPDSLTGLRSFLGMIQYFSAHLHSLSTQLPVLQQLLKKDTPFHFVQVHKDAFDTIMDNLRHVTMLAYADESRDFYIVTDSSTFSAAGCLFQFLPTADSNRLAPMPLAFCARRLTEAEKKFPITHLELINASYCVSKFETFFGTSKIHLYTDCLPLLDLYKKIEKTTGRICRNLTYLLSKGVTIHYVKGKDNCIDFLSRVSNLPPTDAEILSYPSIFQENAPPDSQTDIFFQITSPSPPPDTGPFTYDELKNEQDKDVYISSYVLYLQKGVLQETPRSQAKEIALTASQYVIVDDILYRIIETNIDQKLVIVLPKSLIYKALNFFHSQHHPGIKAMLSQLKSRFHWQTMTHDTTHFVKSCEQCCIFKVNPSQRSFVPGTHSIVPPGVTLFADIAGPFVTAHPSPFRYILVLIDQGSRHVVIQCLKQLDSVSITNEFLNYFFSYGFPHFLVTDSAGYFTSALTKEIFSIFRAHRIPTSPYTPSSQGLVERYIQTIKSKLNPILYDLGTKWPNYIRAIQFAINTTINSTTQVEAAQLFFGRSLRSIFDAQFPLDSIDLPTNQVDYFRETLQTVLLAQRVANQNVLEAIAKRKESKACQPTYHIGDKIWLLCQDPTSKVKYRGPYLITAEYTDNVYNICDACTLQPLRFPQHSRFFKPFVDRIIRPSEENSSDHPPTLQTAELPFDDKGKHLPSQYTVQQNAQAISRLAINKLMPETSTTGSNNITKDINSFFLPKQELPMTPQPTIPTFQSPLTRGLDAVDPGMNIPTLPVDAVEQPRVVYPSADDSTPACSRERIAPPSLPVGTAVTKQPKTAYTHPMNLRPSTVKQRGAYKNVVDNLISYAWPFNSENTETVAFDA